MRKDLFSDSLGFVLTETFCPLISLVTFGFAVLASYKKNVNQVIAWLFVTFLFGATFIGMEIYEFQHLVHAGHGPTHSAFLSAFFTLVGTIRYPRNFWFSVDVGIDVSNQEEWFDTTEYTSSCLLKLVLALP